MHRVPDAVRGQTLSGKTPPSRCYYDPAPRFSPQLPLPVLPLRLLPRRRNPTPYRIPRRGRALGMYADRSSGRKRSVRDRLGSGGGGQSSRSRSDDAKRYRQADGTWKRELYQDSVGTQSSSALSSRSRQANQKSNLQPSSEVVKKSSVPDLREKLSGGQHPQLNSTIQIPKPAPEIAKSKKPVQKRDTPAADAFPAPKKVSAPAPSEAKLSQEKPDASLDSLLKSLDLEKYLVNFEAEEVDMKALIYMNEDDMKSLGIPMGPRKKILQALASKKRKSSKSSPAS